MSEPTTVTPRSAPLGEEQLTQLRAVAAHLLTAPNDSPAHGLGVCLLATLDHIDHLTPQLARLLRYTDGEDFEEAMFQVREWANDSINLDTTVKLYQRQEAKLAEALRAVKETEERSAKVQTLDEIDAEIERLTQRRDDKLIASVLNGTKVGDVVRIVDPNSNWDGAIATLLRIEHARYRARLGLDPDHRSVRLTIVSQMGMRHTDEARSLMRPGKVLVMVIEPPAVCVPHVLDEPPVEPDGDVEDVKARVAAWHALHPELADPWERDRYGLDRPKANMKDTATPTTSEDR